MRRLLAAPLAAMLVLMCCVWPVQAFAPESPAAETQVTVRFHANGSESEAPAPISGKRGEPILLPQVWLSSPLGIEDLYFAGWSERSTAASFQYQPGDTICPMGDMELYAVFARTPSSHTPDAEGNGQPGSVQTGGSHKSYMSGGSDGLFHPDRPLTRAEMAQMLYRIVTEQPSRAAAFSDVPSDSWYAPAVSAIAGLGLLEGYQDGTFRPDQPITRGEAAQALSHLLPAGGAGKEFRDVPPGHPHYAAISSAGGYGLFQGGPEGNFSPDSSLVRAEAAVVFNKLLDRVPDPSAAPQRLRCFPDVPTTHWAYGQVMEAVTTHGYALSGGSEVWRDIQTEPVPLEDGYYRLCGRLYCVSGGQFLRSAAQACFTFDSEGRYTTGDTALDEQLNLLVEQLTTPSMHRDEQLRAVYEYCRDHFSYLKRPLVEAGQTGWEPEYASAFLSMGKGNCYSFSALYCLLARNLGQPAYTVVGGLGTVTAPHGWVEIQLDDVVYLFDPQLEWRYVHDYGRKSHDLFKILPESAPHEYIKLGGGAP